MLGKLSLWISKLISRLKSSSTQGTQSPSQGFPPSSSGRASPTPLPSGKRRLTEHFTIDEATHSNTAASLGISNDPDEEEFDAILDTANRMEAVRDLLKAPIHVSSWFRNPEVNKAVGGSSTSDHMTGRSVDFTCPAFGTPYDVCKAIASSGIRFDQLIYETNARGSQWVHIGFGERMRGQVMTYTPKSGYTNGISRHS